MPKEAVAAFCRKHGVRRLALFGSVLTDRFRPDSDVDVLVEFEPGAHAGFLKLAAMEVELSSVHRSSAVCAILARLPHVERVPGREIVLRWR